MLRRLRQPENLFIVAASTALVLALAMVGVTLTRGSLINPQDSPERILLLPLIMVTNTSLFFAVMLALGLLGTIIVASISAPQGKRTISTGWGWLGFLFAIPLCLLIPPLGGIACLGSACLFLFALIGRDVRFFIASVILAGTLILAGAAVVNSTLSQIELTQSLSIDGNQYALVTVTRSDFDICTDHRYLVVQCDALLMVCESLWQSITYGDLCGQAGFEPKSKALTYDAVSQQLIVHLDDERFTVPLEPPA